MVMRRSTSSARLVNRWAHNYKYHNAAGIWLPPRTSCEEPHVMLDIFKLYDPSEFDSELPGKKKKKKRSSERSSPDLSSPEKTPTLDSQNDDSRSQRSGFSNKSELERKAKLEEEERQKKIATIELRRKLELRLWDLEKTYRYMEHPEVTADRELKCYLLSTI